MQRGPKRKRPCGTPAAAKYHRRHGEPLCDACRQAERRQSAERRGSQPGSDQPGRWAKSPDRREIRNGLPEFKPYVYRGGRGAAA